MKRINEIIERLKRLELIHGDAAVLVVRPNEDGTYVAVDEAHKGQTFTDYEMKRYGGPIIIWDL